MQRRGFTLIEILVVVLIMGIAAAIAVPTMGGTAGSKSTAGARMIMADLLYAQSRAIELQQMTYISFDSVNNQYSVMSSPTVVMTNPSTDTPYTRSFGAAGNSGLPDCALGAPNFDGQTMVAFDYLGAPYSVSNGVATALNSGSVTIGCNGVNVTVQVDPITGQIEVH